MHEVIRRGLIVVALALAGGAVAMTAGEMEATVAAAWASLGTGEKTIQNAEGCTGANFAALKTALEGALGAGASVGTSSWAGSNPNAYCEFTVSLPVEEGAELVEAFSYFSPSARSPASARHVHGVVRLGSARTYLVQLRAVPSGFSRLVVSGPTATGGELVEGCFTPSLTPFAGPSPSEECQPGKGHGRWTDDAPVDPPGRGHREEAPGQKR